MISSKKWTSSLVPKEQPITITERNRTINRIFDDISSKESFLLLGHAYADEDCIGAMVSFGLLLRKFHKNVSIYLNTAISPQLSFFVNICTYNRITIYIGQSAKPPQPDTIFIFDVPKPDLIAANAVIRNLFTKPSIRKIELDHHFSTDAVHTGDKDYRLTPNSSSTCEIIAIMCYKLSKRHDLWERFAIHRLYTRNIVLSMLTGILGDARLGNFLISKRDKGFYAYFTAKFNELIQQETDAETKNIHSLTELYTVLNSFSDEEHDIYHQLKQYMKYINAIGLMVINPMIMELLHLPQNYDLFIGVVKNITNELADHAPFIGLTVIFDPPHISDNVQVRIRCSEEAVGIDLRAILKKCQFKNGGGHPGAIAFRLKQSEINNFEFFLDTLIKEIRILLHNAQLI